MHLINWDRITQPKRMGGLGLKKFKTMNQALLNKQYWRLCQNPNSLLAKTVKARYFPNSSIQDYRAKSHHSWVWRNTIKVDQPLLREGKWRVGNGYNIPLNHKDWFPHSNFSAHQSHLLTGTMGDLIDDDARTWKADLIRKLYHFHRASSILQITISKTNSVQDTLCWKFSNNGEFQVHKVYDLLSRNYAGQSSSFQAHSGWWRSFWKIKVPLKVSNFVWKLLNNCLPTFHNLHVRGISNGNLCLMCNEEEESLTHLFLLCPFTRACWHGTTLAIHSSDFLTCMFNIG